MITGAMVGVVREQAQAEKHRTAAALEEARGELDQLRAAEAEHARQADALRAELADAVAARERAEHDSRQVRARVETAESHATTARQEASEARLALAAAQVAAGLVLPDLADLSGDLGDGVRGVALPEAGICVARQPDGAVVLHQQDRQVRLGEDEHAPAYGRALAAGLLAVVTSPATRQEGDDHA
ncbi:hypothetical protein [Nonomuraea bangladeshensis]|uniref:hypothetical protein n=1 Tax=Nonomuraea bangladeshensis TaxID=404385 RepID=UPI003C2BE542